MVKTLRRPKANARSKAAGYAQPEVVGCERIALNSDDLEDPEAIIYMPHPRVAADTRSLEQKIQSLVYDAFGNSVHLVGFQLDMEAGDGDIRYSWRSPL